MNDMDDPVLTEAELFEYLHYDEGLTAITRSTIRLAVRRREIQPYRLGNKHRLSKRDGLNWVGSRKQAGRYVATNYRVPAVAPQEARTI